MFDLYLAFHTVWFFINFKCQNRQCVRVFSVSVGKALQLVFQMMINIFQPLLPYFHPSFSKIYGLISVMVYTLCLFCSHEMQQILCLIIHFNCFNFSYKLVAIFRLIHQNFLSLQAFFKFKSVAQSNPL